mgnify:CR=1 FL=1
MKNPNTPSMVEPELWGHLSVSEQSIFNDTRDWIVLWLRDNETRALFQSKQELVHRGFAMDTIQAAFVLYLDT